MVQIGAFGCMRSRCCGSIAKLLAFHITKIGTSTDTFQKNSNIQQQQSFQQDPPEGTFYVVTWKIWNFTFKNVIVTYGMILDFMDNKTLSNNKFVSNDK